MQYGTIDKASQKACACSCSSISSTASSLDSLLLDTRTPLRGPAGPPQAECVYAVAEGVDRELRKSEDARTARSGSRCTRLVERGTPRTVRCAAFFVRSENSSALVGDGLLQFELPGQLHRVQRLGPALGEPGCDISRLRGLLGP